LVFRVSLVGYEFFFWDIGLVELLHPSIASCRHWFMLLMLVLVLRRAFFDIAADLLFKPS